MFRLELVGQFIQLNNQVVGTPRSGGFVSCRSEMALHIEATSARLARSGDARTASVSRAERVRRHERGELDRHVGIAAEPHAQAGPLAGDRS